MTQLTTRREAIGLTVNGRARAIPAGSTIVDLLTTLGIDPRMVVVEHNGQILRDRADLTAHPLNSGDQIEIVHFVGGG